jgi:hypothetical protein
MDPLKAVGIKHKELGKHELFNFLVFSYVMLLSTLQLAVDSRTMYNSIRPVQTSVGCGLPSFLSPTRNTRIVL